MPRRLLRSLVLPLALGAVGCGSTTPPPAPSPSPSRTALADEHLAIDYSEGSPFASFRLHAESCHGVAGPWRGTVESRGLMSARSDLAWGSPHGLPAEVELTARIGGGSSETDGGMRLRGRVRITPSSHPSPIAGEPPTHQLRLETEFVTEDSDGATPLPPLDQYLIARPLGPCTGTEVRP